MAYKLQHVIIITKDSGSKAQDHAYNIEIHKWGVASQIRPILLALLVINISMGEIILKYLIRRVNGSMYLLPTYYIDNLSTSLILLIVVNIVNSRNKMLQSCKSA